MDKPDPYQLETEPRRLEVTHATGYAAELLEEYGNLRGHPAWMGVGINQMYSDEMILEHIRLAKRMGVGYFLIVLAHEVAAENKLSLKKPPFHALRNQFRDGVARLRINHPAGPRSIPIPPVPRDPFVNTPQREKAAATEAKYRQMADERKTALVQAISRELGPTALMQAFVMTQDEVYQHLLSPLDPYIELNKQTLLETLILHPLFQEDMEALFQQVVPGLWRRIQRGEIHMPSVYRYTIEQIYLTFALLRFKGIPFKMGPQTEQGPDQIFENFKRDKYARCFLDLPNAEQHSFIYTRNSLYRKN